MYILKHCNAHKKYRYNKLGNQVTTIFAINLR